MAGKVTDFDALTTLADDDVFYVVQVSDGTDKKIAYSSLEGKFLTVSDYPSDSAWTTTTSLLNGWTGTVRYIKRAGVVYVVVQLDGSSASSTVVLQLPAAYVPDETIRGTAVGVTGIDVPLSLSVFTSSALVVEGGGNTNTDIRGSITYPVL